MLEEDDVKLPVTEVRQAVNGSIPDELNKYAIRVIYDAARMLTFTDPEEFDTQDAIQIDEEIRAS